MAKYFGNSKRRKEAKTNFTGGENLETQKKEFLNFMTFLKFLMFASILGKREILVKSSLHKMRFNLHEVRLTRGEIKPP